MEQNYVNVTLCMSNEPCAGAVRTDRVGESRREFVQRRDVACWLQQQLLLVTPSPVTSTVQQLLRWNWLVTGPHCVSTKIIS